MITRYTASQSLHYAYKYLVLIVVLLSPLLPFTLFGVSYEALQVSLTVGVISCALLVYLGSCFLGAGIQPLTRSEFYTTGIAALFLALTSMVSHTPLSALVGGEGISMYGGVPLLAVLVLVYLVRHLGGQERKILKAVLLGMLAVSLVVQIGTYFAHPVFLQSLASLFHFNAYSFAVWIGVAMCVFVATALRKRDWNIKEISLAITVFVLIGSAVFSAVTKLPRPDIAMSYTVAARSLASGSLIGVGADGYIEAWHKYKPDEILATKMADATVPESGSLLATLLTLYGIGACAFFMIALAALRKGVMHIAQIRDNQERGVLVALLTVLVYLLIAVIMLPVGYSVLLLLGIVSGLVYGKVSVREKRILKESYIVLIPVLLVLLLGTYVLIERISLYVDIALVQSDSQETRIATLEKLVSAGNHYSYVHAMLASEYGARLAKETNPALAKEYNARVIGNAQAAHMLAPTNPDYAYKYLRSLVRDIPDTSALASVSKIAQEFNQVYPRHIGIALESARLFVKNKQTDRALVLYNHIEDVHGFDPVITPEHISVLVSVRDFDGALAVINTLQARSLQTPLYESLRGDVYFASKQYELAAASYEKASKLDTSKPQFVYSQIISLNALGKKRDAYNLAVSLAQNFPAYDPVLHYLKSLTK